MNKKPKVQMVQKRKHLKKVGAPAIESDDYSSGEDNDDIVVAHTQSSVNQNKNMRKALKEEFASDDYDDDAEESDEDDDGDSNDEKPAKAGIKRSAVDDRNLKKIAKKPKFEAASVVKSELAVTTAEKAKLKVSADKKQKLQATCVEKQKIQKSSATLYVRVPPKNFLDSTKVHHFFAVRGLENSVRSIKKRNFLFVELADETLMGKALKLSGERMEGLELHVERANAPPEQSQQQLSQAKREEAKQRAALIKQAKQEAADRVKLFVKNLPSDVTEASLKEHFPKATSVRLPRSVDKTLKGFAFVEFENELVAEKVMAKKQGSAMGDKTISIDFVGKKSINAKPSQKIITDDPTRTLFVKQLAWQTTADDLKKAFSPCTSVRLATFPDSGKSRGYGFVIYETPQQAEEARVRMSSATLDGRTIVIGFARTPEQNAAQKKRRAEVKRTNKTKENEKPKNVEQDVVVPGKKNSKSKAKKEATKSEEPARDLVKLKRKKEGKKMKSVKVKMEKSSEEPLKKRVKL